eukprot:3786753-Rhodomonas_salina.1
MYHTALPPLADAARVRYGSLDPVLGNGSATWTNTTDRSKSLMDQISEFLSPSKKNQTGLYPRVCAS